MKKNANTERLAEEALNSIDNIQEVEVNDFIFTRIQRRFEAKKIDAARKLKVMYRLSAVLILFLVVNIASYYFLTQTKSTSSKQNITGITAFADDYKMEQSSYSY